jgi:lipopolysaccharide biosynthesis glycosyltransferase
VTLHVACSADSRFASDCAVMLASLGEHNRDVTVHFLHDERITAEGVANLGSVVRDAGGAWDPQPVSPKMTERFPHSERYGYSAWYRILLPAALPDVDRVVYLDSDLLITSSLRSLYDVDLGDALLAAVTQPTLPDVLPRLRETLGLPDAASYFNSGVMTLDLRRLRESRCVDEVLAFIDEGRGPMPWADQDPLNAVLHRRRLRLHPRWNVMTPLFELPAAMLPFSADEIRQAVADPAVIHFIGPYKPWHYRCRHPYRRRYFEYLDRTPWRGRPIEGRTARHVLIRPWPSRWQPRIDSVVDRGIEKARRIRAARS